ncbi:MAG: LytTR family transcriptional regulator [Bacteroidaceae bacterium]|nr:LytTR family transcriptional regulator [Bacteroidaceae bacterium]
MKETIKTRVISTTFVILALGVFKPFGLDGLEWQAYADLAALWVIGFLACMLTDVILKYIVNMPRSIEHGVNYIIRRNLWFQIINTPLVTLGICLYRHFVLSNRVEGNQFSVVNFLETLVIIAFCSYIIGLYWRFKFHSTFLSAELKETMMLNEELKEMQQPTPEPTPTPIEGSSDSSVTDNGNRSPLPWGGQGAELTLRGTTNDSVTLQITDLLYIEAVGNYVKVIHLKDGQVRTDMLRATSKQMEDNLIAYPTIVRCHRAFLVNLSHVEKIVSQAGAMQLLIKHSHDMLPVSRSNIAKVKKAIKGTD